MEKQSYFKLLRLVLVSVVIVVLSSLLSSCEDDTPDPKIDYYFTIASKPPDYYPVSRDDMVYVITRIMKDSIKAVYSKRTLDGNDKEVVQVCDRIYYRYRDEHPEAYKYFFCIATLHRACMTGTVIRKDVKIRYYDF